MYIMKRVLFFLFFVFFVNLLSAQSVSDLANVNVDALTSAQLQRINREIQNRGLSMSEFENLAMARGMSASNVARLRARLNEIPETNAPSQSEIITADETDPFEELMKAKRSGAKSTPENPPLSIFGSKLFQSDKLNFAPSLNIPVPKDYVLGPNDVLSIIVYGAAQASYALEINKNGFLVVPDLGPIFLNGISFDKATTIITNRLSEIFSGLNDPNAKVKTDVQISVSSYRSISISIVGEVTNPGTYTVPSLATVMNALYVSGGPTQSGTMRDIEIIRDNEVITTFDVYDFLVYSQIKNNIRLQDQDIIKVGPYINRVKLNGRVKVKGAFELKEKETLYDLLKFGSGLSENAYNGNLTIYRKTGIEKEILTEKIPDISKRPNKNELVPLISGDSVVIHRILDRFANKVEIKGAVWKPGVYALEDGFSVQSLIDLAEGLKGDEFRSRATISRFKENYEVEVVSFSLDDDLSAIKLKKDDVVRIASIFDLRAAYTVTITGEVQADGTIPFQENMTLKDAIFAADGFNESASYLNIEISRRLTEQSDKKIDKLAEVFTFEVDESLTLSEEDANFKLMPFDIIYVRRNPMYTGQIQVSIRGEINFPGNYTVISKDERLSDLVERSGGLTEEAYIKGARLIRISNDAGRIGVDLEKALANKKSKFDIFLEAGDQLVIPKQLQTVKVRGAVMFPNSVIYTENKGFKHYLNQAGGYKEDGNKKKAYVVYANGEADRQRNFLFFKKYPKIEPGSEVVVPAIPQKEPISRQERIAMATALVSLASMTMFLINNIRAN